jgi:hypothetical protein
MRNSIPYPIQHWLLTLLFGTIFISVFTFLTTGIDQFIGTLFSIISLLFLRVYLSSVLTLVVGSVLYYFVKDSKISVVKFKLIIIIPTLIIWFSTILFNRILKAKFDFIIWLLACIIAGIIARKNNKRKVSTDLVDDF